MRTLTFCSDLAATPAEVWARVVTPEGIDDELRPWLTMRLPRRWRSHSIADLPLEEPLGRAWLRLFGVVPVDADHLCLTEVEPGRMFRERSRLLTARRWEHRRTVTPYGGGSRVSDVLGIEGRWPVLTPVVALVAATLFRHRHRRLARRFGPLHR